MPCDILSHLSGVQESSRADAPEPAIKKRVKRHGVLKHHPIKANGFRRYKRPRVCNDFGAILQEYEC